jgi:hypothetical protein
MCTSKCLLHVSFVRNSRTLKKATSLIVSRIIICPFCNVECKYTDYKQGDVL